MTDTVSVALIGVAGMSIGAMATVIVARIQARQKARDEAREVKNVPNPKTPVLGDLVDIRELRLLRALFAEPSGRFLTAYRNTYYHAAVEAVQSKGWVRHVDGRFYMTDKGAEFCRAYLKEQFDVWDPTKQLLSERIDGERFGSAGAPPSPSS